MLPKRKRITKALFQDIMENGKVIHGSFFILRYKVSEYPAYAVVAPKSIAKQAVNRNKLRRQGYSVIRERAKIPSILGIFFYKKEAKNIKFQEIKSGINTILDKINH